MLDKAKNKLTKIKKELEAKLHRFWIETKWQLNEDFVAYLVSAVTFLGGFILGVVIVGFR